MGTYIEGASSSIEIRKPRGLGVGRQYQESHGCLSFLFASDPAVSPDRLITLVIWAEAEGPILYISERIGNRECRIDKTGVKPPQ
jgi:hypothetical protein